MTSGKLKPCKKPYADNIANVFQMIEMELYMKTIVRYAI